MMRKLKRKELGVAEVTTPSSAKFDDFETIQD